MKTKNALGILSSEVPTGNLLWADAVNGVDALAVRGRMTIPFKTLTAAKKAALSGTEGTVGDTIIVMPGSYNETDLLKDQVNWHFMPGAKIHVTESVDSIFSDHGDPVTCRIDGAGDFIHEGGADAIENYAVLHLANSDSSVSFTAMKLKNTAEEDSYAYTVLVADASATDGLILNCQVLEAATDNPVLEVNGTASVKVTCERLQTTAAIPAIKITNGTVRIQAKEIVNTYQTAWVFDGQVHLTAHSICGGSPELYQGQFYIEDGKFHLQCEHLLSIGACAVQVHAAEVCITAQRITCDTSDDAPTIGCFVYNATGTLFMEAQYFETIGDGGNVRGFYFQGGTSFVRGHECRIRGGSGVTVVGGDHLVEGLRIDTTAFDSYENSPVWLGGNGLTLRNCWLVAPASSNSIDSYYTDPQDVKCHGVAANKAEDTILITVLGQALLQDDGPT